MGIDGACQFERMVAGNGFRIDDNGLGPTLGIDERGIGLALRAQALNVNLCRLQLRLEREAVTLGQYVSILEYHGIAAIHHVLRGLTEATRRVDIAAERTGTLLSQQGAQIAVLAYQFVAGRTVEDNVGAGHRQPVAGRDGCPHVLTNLYAKLDAVAGLVDRRLGCQIDGGTGQINLHGVEILCGSKPALLVELIVIGQIGLCHQSQQCTPLNDGGTVEQQSLGLHGQSHDADDIQGTREVQEAHQTLLSLDQQQLFLKQVLTTVARQAQLREAYHLNILTVGKGDELFHLLYVILNVSYFHGRHCCCHLHESVSHIATIYIFTVLTTRNRHSSGNGSREPKRSHRCDASRHGRRHSPTTAAWTAADGSW